ncbi:MAG: hypothetical protein S4CHLAM37_14240 [Chlamydiia bacterium]|nr:hypothetical protein [Chlamydiia bacterium]
MEDASIHPDEILQATSSIDDLQEAVMLSCADDADQLKAIDSYAFGMSIFMLLKKDEYTSPFISDINEGTRLGKYNNELSFSLAVANYPELTVAHLWPLLNEEKVTRLDPTGELRELMMRCLSENPLARPSFEEISDLLR